MEKKLNIKQKRVMSYFILSAKKLIEEEGVEKLTVRKVAADAGYNSATLYNYFEDMEELLVFASMGYLKQYIAKLGNALSDEMNAIERYRMIYQVFSETCFEKPDIFYSLFYGKYKKRLKAAVSVYYDIFPDELGQHGGEVLQMLTQGEIFQRDMAIMPSLVQQGFVAERKVKQTVILITRMFQSYLYDAWIKNDERNIESQINDVMETFDYIMETAR